MYSSDISQVLEFCVFVTLTVPAYATITSNSAGAFKYNIRVERNTKTVFGFELMPNNTVRVLVTTISRHSTDFCGENTFIEKNLISITVLKQGKSNRCSKIRWQAVAQALSVTSS
jgi:hypothetical protein